MNSTLLWRLKIRRAFSTCLTILSLPTAFGMFGCAPVKPDETERKSTDAPPSQTNDNQYNLDLGIVLEQNSTYCYPLSDFGIDSRDELMATESSCECIDAKAVAYIDTNGDRREGLRIFVTNEPGAMSLRSAQALRARLVLHRINSEAPVTLLCDIVLSGKPNINRGD